jgi:sodium/potassium-transporting ATPase subunit alpha
VPGDVITLNFGDNIPADVVLFKANEMKVNNASLTGESEDLLRKVDAKTANIFESPNVGFFGTMCTAGTGTGIVIRTGDDTVIGRIANLSQSAESAETPLAIEIERFILIVSMVAFTLGISFLIFGFIIGYGPIMNLVFAIGIIVANVPEGLLATVTVSLALTARRMAKKMVLVKNLESVETLGSTSCICSDKTGTLTQNRMTVSQIFFNRKVINASVNYQSYKEGLKREHERAANANEEVNLKNVPTPDYDTKDQDFMTLVRTIALSTTSYFSYTPGNDVIRARWAKDKKINVDKVPKTAETPEDKELHKQYAEELIEIENQKPYFKQNVEGDASETGLVKFVQPILDTRYEGEYENGMSGCRNTFPIVKYGAENTEAKIPFSSDIKFNLLIRDANKDCDSPTCAADNMTVYLKGAPDRVI